jgi:hypothetical protein
VVPWSGTIRDQVQGQLHANAAGLPPELSPVTEALGRAKAAAFWGTLEGEQVKLRAGLMCSDPTSATHVTDALHEYWNKQVNGAGAKLGMAFLPGPIKGLVEELIQSTQFSSQNDLTLVGAQVSRQSVQGLGAFAPPGAFGPPGDFPMPGGPPDGFPLPGGRRPRLPRP